MPALLQAAHGAAPALPSYGASLLQALTALVGVCVLAYLVMRHGLGRVYAAAGAGRRMRIRERLPLDPRRALLLVEVGERVYLVGTGDGGAPSLLAEVPRETVPGVERAEPTRATRALVDREP